MFDVRTVLCVKEVDWDYSKMLIIGQGQENTKAKKKLKKPKI